MPDSSPNPPQKGSPPAKKGGVPRSGLLASFFQPHEEAAALVQGKTAVSREIFYGLLPELRARAFTVSGLEALNEIERVRDQVELYARGQTAGGEAVTWDDAKQSIVSSLAWDDADAAEKRATLLLRTHGFQAFQAGVWRDAQADEDTTHLQYLATEDTHVRATHLALNGLVLPKDDPFWNAHYPPWDWGCRCSVRPMNPDLVEAERQADEQRAPEERNVLEGALAERLRTTGELQRGPITLPDGSQAPARQYNVLAPKDGPEGESAFQWHPGELRLSLEQLRARYDAERFAEFEQWAKGTEFAPGRSVWDWLAES